MWILIQENTEKTKMKYLCSHDYNVIISYINSYSNVEKIDDYLFANEDLLFSIRLGEDLDTYEKKK